MYPLAPHRVGVFALTLFFFVSPIVYAAADRFQLSISDWKLASCSTGAALLLITLCIGKPWYNSPWRILWRRAPKLNHWVFPDLNGVWIGSTQSNWPTIERLFETAQISAALTEDELRAVPERQDQIVVEVRASVFSVKLSAYLASTGSQSSSITVRPIRFDWSDAVHLLYVYEQRVPDPERTDERAHFGAAELLFPSTDSNSASGVYWTQRNWKLGLNTAGKITLRRVTEKRDPKRTLSDYLLPDEPKAETGQ